MAIKPQPSFSACQHNTKKPVFEMVNVTTQKLAVKREGWGVQTLHAPLPSESHLSNHSLINLRKRGGNFHFKFII